MPKFDVDTIKEEAKRSIRTLDHYRGQEGEQEYRPLSIKQLRICIKKVLFLCKEIERLNKRLAP